LQLLRLVRHSFRQGMQMQIKIPDGYNGANKNNADDDHQDVSVTWSRDEAWQMMGGHGMKGLAHVVLHSEMRPKQRVKAQVDTQLRRMLHSLHKAGTWQAQACRASSADRSLPEQIRRAPRGAA
jgi:hypothetical protein